ncbi:Uncharacterised protein [Mycobacteroides abscessus subsp. abscessus]|nr:Uncharacterised protein [Mycobacteroides abscessus subsp. abscessus]
MFQRTTGSGLRFIQPFGVIPGGAQNHQVGLRRLRVIPGQPPGMQIANTQRGNEFGVIAIASDELWATGQNNARMENIRPSQPYVRATHPAIFLT